MAEETQYIPIKNLYYLLCYAWGLADQRERVKVDASLCKTYPDLFAKLLIHGCSLLLKRGLQREYTEIQQSVLGIKGKLNISDSIKNPRYRLGKMDCSFDEYSEDILLNQIICASLRRLIGYKQLSANLRKEAQQTYNRFPKIEDVVLTADIFSQVVINRENRFYFLLIHICQLIFNSLLPDEKQQGQYHFVSFSQEQMDSIFENFLFHFYRKECKAEYPTVERSGLRYNLEAVGSSSNSVLPLMRTDVTLINTKAGRKIILDAKYYMETLKAHYSEKSFAKVRNGHINQIMAYIFSQQDAGIPYTMNANGILVYPKVQGDLDYTGHYKGTNHFFRFCTVDLNQDWQAIEQRLREIIKFDN